MSEDLSRALAALQRDEVLESVTRRIANAEDPLGLLDECRRGMTIIGERFKSGDYFLADLLLSAEIFKEAAAILDPHLAKTRAPEPPGTVVLATMRGDIHDLGKNIVATLLRAHAFEVHDLGVDVAPDRLVETVRETKPDFVGFSALLTTAFTSMKEAAEMLVRAGIRDRLKLMIGGGVTTPAVKEYVGADFQTMDATTGVSYCLQSARETVLGT